MNIPCILIAGTHSGVGKTTVTLGLMGALTQKALRVQGFKAGPDYIDPSHHTFITSMKSRNLDTWMLGENAVMELFFRSARNADIAIVEGVMGMYDGYSATDEHGSTAHLAKLLNAPVILVIDAKGMARSSGALVLGYQQFDKDVRLAGVIANNIAGERHFEFVKPAIEQATHIPVLGYLLRDAQMTMDERHLGLIPHREGKVEAERYDKMIQNAIAHIDLNHVVKLAKNAVLHGDCPNFKPGIFNGRRRSRQDDGKADIFFARSGEKKPKSVRIGVAYDEAFNFYYQDNLDILEHLGAEIVFFSPLNDEHLPPSLDLIYIGGGFPELFAKQLSENRSLMREMRAYVEAMKPIYAECGGLMYLGQSIDNFEGERAEMVGILPVRSAMQRKRLSLGYVEVEAQRDTIICAKGERFRGHEFHWSNLEEVGNVEYAYRSSQRSGKLIKQDGIVVKNVLAAYVHLHFATNRRLAENLIKTANLSR
ncbi:TPA: cobyrinate a,c-diamide synthase [Candidatus Poribacteria bacterium]|nr:cobyrinate a,c-diamide synthase [Candidatus Poribacteria bacterium]